MYRSGIALTAIAALLIPIDFYTLYVNFNIPPEHTPIFWFITSLVCLAAYIAITLLTQSSLFGYLVGTAAGGAILSLVEIGHQHFALARDWDAAALALLAVALMLIATALSRARPNRWRVMAEPFRNLALIAAGAIMLLSFGWRYIDRKTYDALHYSMTLSWWLGGLLFGWGAIHYRSRTLGILAALALPIATFFAQAALFDQTRTSPAWHAFGLALLVPIYLTVGNKLLARTRRQNSARARTHGDGLGHRADDHRRALVADEFDEQRRGGKQSRGLVRRDVARALPLATAADFVRGVALRAHDYRVCDDRVKLVAQSVCDWLGVVGDCVHRRRVLASPRFGLAVGMHALWNGGSLIVVVLGGAQFFGKVPAEVNILGVTAAGTMLALLIVLGLAALWLGRATAQRAQSAIALEPESLEAEFMLTDRAIAIWAFVCLVAIVPVGVTALRLLLR